ncbi:MAG: hypothetical protein MUD03_10150 [Pirellula sp.]|nr:hypothetical protein [Pirellula sp.]
MQVLPPNWSNPAAATQQAMQHPRAASTANSSPSTPAIPDVGKAEKAGDRDADGRYDGPMGGGSRDSTEEAEREENELHHPDLSLPADMGEESKLDLLG